MKLKKFLKTLYPFQKIVIKTIFSKPYFESKRITKKSEILKEYLNWEVYRIYTSEIIDYIEITIRRDKDE